MRHHGLVCPGEPPAGGQAVGQAPVVAVVDDHAAVLPLRGLEVSRHHDPVALLEVGPGTRPRQQPPGVAQVGGDVAHLAPASAFVPGYNLEIVHRGDAVVVAVTVQVCRASVKMKNNIVPEI